MSLNLTANSRTWRIPIAFCYLVLHLVYAVAKLLNCLRDRVVNVLGEIDQILYTAKLQVLCFWNLFFAITSKILIE